MPICQLQLGARSDEGGQRFLVAQAAVAQHDGFDHGRPVQVVDMVQRRTGRNQLPDHPVMAQVGGGDQCRAVIATGDLLGGRPQGQQHAQRFLVVGNGGNRDAVVAVFFKQVEIGACLGERADCARLSGKGGDMQRCSPVTVAGIEVGLGAREFFNLRCVAPVGGGVQALVAGGFGGARADLGFCRNGRQDSQDAGCAQPLRSEETSAKNAMRVWVHGRILHGLRRTRSLVDNERMKRLDLQSLTPQRLLAASVAMAVVTIVLKTLAWYITGSVGLLSDAMESFVNLASAIFGLVMVTIAQRPADVDHPYGHHKAEYFSSGFEGVLIIGAAAAIIWAAAARIAEPQALQQVGWGLALSILSSALNGLLAWVMFQSARKYRSIALEADAKHLVTDVWTSAGVVIGIVIVTLTGWLWLDALVAIAVALNILREGFKLIWRSSQGLMDEAVEPAVLAQITQTLEVFQHPTIRFDHLTTRRSGQRCFVDLHMHMPADWSLRRAAALRISVEQALMSAVPGLRATIQLLPSDVEPHFNDERDLI